MAGQTSSKVTGKPARSTVSLMHGLQWRLMFYYILVTVVATFLIGVIVMAWLTNELFFMHQKPQVWVEHARQTAGAVSHFVDHRPVDKDDIDALIKKERDAVLHAGDDDDAPTPRHRLITLNMHINPFPKNIAIVIVDSSGRIVDGSAIAGAAPGIPLQPLLEPAETELVDRALHGEKRVDQLGIVDAVGIDAAAYPIVDADGGLAGAVFERARTTIGYRDWLIGSGSLVLFYTVFMALVASVLGSVFSYVTSRGLTSRVEVIADAAMAWSRGDFTARALEKPGDEIGELGRRLNGMAREVSDLLALRQRLASAEERNRLARDLHDTVKQQAFATAMQIGAARERFPDTASKTHLDEAATLVAAMQQELKSILKELSDDGPVDVALILSERVGDWSRRTGIEARSEIAAVSPLPAGTAATVLAIVEEALSNVARHSQAKVIDVGFDARQDGRVELTIADDGRGIASTSLSGMGLANMRQRAESLPEGQFTLRSDDGAGVRVSVSFAKKGDEIDGKSR